MDSGFWDDQGWFTDWVVCRCRTYWGLLFNNAASSLWEWRREDVSPSQCSQMVYVSLQSHTYTPCTHVPFWSTWTCSVGLFSHVGVGFRGCQKILGVSSDLRHVFDLFSPTPLPETWWSELFLLLFQRGDRWVSNSEKHVFLHQIPDVVRTTQAGLRQYGLSGDKQDLRLFWQGNFSKQFESSLGGDKQWNVEGYPSVDCLGLLGTVTNMLLRPEFCAVVK